MDAMIKKVVQHRPDAVAELMEAYGVQAEPTERNLQNLLKVYGNTPLPYSNATGNISQPKTTLLDKIVGIATGIGNIIKLNKQAAVAVPGTVYAGTNTTNIDPEQTPRIFGINRTVFLVLAGLIVLSIGLIVFKNK